MGGTGTERDDAASQDRLAVFLADNPLVESVDVILPDIVGIARGKRFDIGELRAALRGEALFSSTLYALDTTGANVDRSGLVWEEGDADRPIRLDDATLAPVPWASERAQILGGLGEADGQPFFADPRAVLGRVAEGFAAFGLKPVCALELEFYLLDLALDADGLGQLPTSTRLGRRPREVEVYSFDRLREIEPFLDLVADYCDAQDIPAKGAVAEFAPGQFEVNLRHVHDPVRAADHALLFKRCVKAAALESGFRACFMAKPFPETSGSGLHIHLSLEDEDGRNVLADGEAGELTLRHAVWGLQQAMAESMLVFAPNANSYRRLQPLSYAPTAPSWGINNRTVALRVPAGAAAARRIEHRAPGADANPYLATAAMFAGVLHGLEHKGDPGPPMTGNAYEKARRTVPTNWAEALLAFERGSLLKRFLGERFCDLYAACRRAEFDRFEARLSPLDFEWYLSAV
ncbi:MAG: glutamine synthetase family protein [Geminicoccaceae bacterium]